MTRWKFDFGQFWPKNLFWSRGEKCTGFGQFWPKKLFWSRGEKCTGFGQFDPKNLCGLRDNSDYKHSDNAEFSVKCVSTVFTNEPTEPNTLSSETIKRRRKWANEIVLGIVEMRIGLLDYGEFTVVALSPVVFLIVLINTGFPYNCDIEEFSLRSLFCRLL